MSRFPFLIIFLMMLLLFVGCAAKRPVLYPNNHLERVGKNTAEIDINDCLAIAKENVKSEKSKKVAGKTATGSAIGAVTGFAVGAVFGDSGKSAAAGAVGGGAGGFMSGIFESDEPDPVFKRFVERCLLEKGYEPIGWR